MLQTSGSLPWLEGPLLRGPSHIGQTGAGSWSSVLCRMGLPEGFLSILPTWQLTSPEPVIQEEAKLKPWSLLCPCLVSHTQYPVANTALLHSLGSVYTEVWVPAVRDPGAILRAGHHWNFAERGCGFSWQGKAALLDLLIASPNNRHRNVSRPVAWIHTTVQTHSTCLLSSHHGCPSSDCLASGPQSKLGQLTSIRVFLLHYQYE